MKKPLLLLGVLLLQACSDDDNSSKNDGISFDKAEPFEQLSAGDATVFQFDVDAFSLPSANMSTSRKFHFNGGNRFFTDPFEVAGEPDALGRDGLGPNFNVSSCQACHLKDGRGHAPVDTNDVADTLLLRLSVPADADQLAKMNAGEMAAVGHPVYGGQLQDKSTDTGLAEGKVAVNWTPKIVTFADGFEVELREPTFTIENPNYGPLGDDIQISARVAQPMIGLGFLEAIPESVIVDQADEHDSDGDGISGRVNRVTDAVTGETGVLGRFGWKAINPTVKQQTAGASNGDIGMTTSLFPSDNCTDAQRAEPYNQCNDSQYGNSPGNVEIADDILDQMAFYSRNLAVPARRDHDDPEVLKGKQLFYESGCTSCHTPKYQLPDFGDIESSDIDGLKEQSNQLIWPYTDMLLHDMGEDLADNHQEFGATGAEWRTPALWGVGLTHVVDPNATFLHDGRARTLMEAVLWHGGEAEAAQKKVLQFNADQRSALDAFLMSL